MESQPQYPEFCNNPEYYNPCTYLATAGPYIVLMLSTCVELLGVRTSATPSPC